MMIKKIIFTLIVATFVVGCSQQKPMTSSKKRTSVQPTTGRVEYKEMQASYDAKEYEKYLDESSKFLVKYPTHEYNAEICYNRGMILLGLKRYSEASAEFTKVTKAHTSSEFYPQSLYYYALSEYKENNPNDSLKALSKLDDVENIDKDLYTKSKMLSANIFAEQGDRKKALDYLSEFYTNSSDLESRAKVKVYALSIIDKMNTSELRGVESRYENTDWIDSIIFKLGEKYFDEESMGAARDRFSTIISSYPNSEYRLQAEAYLSRLEGADKSDPFTIGVILPLSGRNAAFGTKTLLGIQLAVGVFGTQKTKSPIKLSVMDSQSDPEVARLAVEKLLLEDKVSAIIGPLSGDEAESVAKQCSLSGVPNITLSQKDVIDGLGKYVFRMSMTNRGQIKRLVDYSMDELGLTKFGILYPNDNYGQELSRYFWEEVLKRGGEITAVEYYEPGQPDFRDEVRKLLGMYYVASRLPELRELEKQEEEKTKAEGATKNKKDKVELPPIVSFEGLFIPDDARVAAQISNYLPYYDARSVVLLGTNTWNSKRLISRGGTSVEGAVFVDGFYSNPSFEEGRNFYQDFKESFNSSPGILEAQGYDAGKLVSKAVESLTDGGRKKDAINREKLRKEISSMGSFTGATGKMFFDNSGEIQKELFVLSVNEGKIILKK